MVDRIRELIASRRLLPIAVEAISDEADLYELGLTPFASVQLMLALEDDLHVVFPDRMLEPETFASIAAIGRSLGELTVAAT
jgi:acyl carrier protein